MQIRCNSICKKRGNLVVALQSFKNLSWQQDESCYTREVRTNLGLFHYEESEMNLCQLIIGHLLLINRNETHSNTPNSILLLAIRRNLVPTAVPGVTQANLRVQRYKVPIRVDEAVVVGRYRLQLRRSRLLRSFFARNESRPFRNWRTTSKRIGIAPSDVHAASGQWQVVDITSDDDLTTYKTNGNELTLSRATGETYTAKFDGNEYLAKGTYAYDTVSLKRLGERSFEETDKLKGKVVEIDTSTVSNDGKTLATIGVTSDRKSTFVSTKVKM